MLVLKKEDKRVIKTKRDLRNALGDLLKKKSYSKITVCDICEEAQINRMTFYKHYMDKSDLLNDVFNFDRILYNDFAKLKSGDAKCQEIIDCALPIVERIATECLDKKEIIKAMYEDDFDVIGDVVYKAIRKVTEEIFNIYLLKHKCKYDGGLICEFLTGGATKVFLSYVATKENFTKEKLVSDMVSVFEIILKSDVFEQD